MLKIHPLRSPLSWQQALSDCITSPAELIQILGLDPVFIHSAELIAKKFPLRVPRGYVARMKPGDINDPLLHQVLPIAAEMAVHADYTADPVGDLEAAQLSGLLHKYHGRVLLTLSGACAINCRFCFRRAFPYEANLVGAKQWQDILRYISNDSSIAEVIFSGGDPLVASDKRLAAMVEDLAAISHVKYVRFHTRLPIVLPERITDEMITWLTATRLRPVIIVHCNHPNEVDESVRFALDLLRAAGVQLYNQFVLLKGVNNNVEVLKTLQTVLFDSGVQPYYLHLLDKVQGAAHFEVSEAEAKQLHRDLQAVLPGYLVPKLVREVAGELAKTPVF